LPKVRTQQTKIGYILSIILAKYTFSEDIAMNIVLWMLQVIGGLYFFYTGVSHFIVPPGLPG
jgi:hypothetical protein